MISIIVATTKNGVIGKTGNIPWYLPADLTHFKDTTMGHPIVMGRVTHDSIGKALPGRRNIIITRQPGYAADQCEVVNSLSSAIELAKNASEIFVIGGQEVYSQALPIANKIYLTEIETVIDGDKFFLFESNDWQVISSEKHSRDDKNEFDYTFLVLERKQNDKIKP